LKLNKDIIIIIYIYLQLILQYFYDSWLLEKNVLWLTSTLLGIFIISMIYFFRKEQKSKKEKTLYVSLILLILIDIF
jgi:chromate transport protein ChrA